MMWAKTDLITKIIHSISIRKKLLLNSHVKMITFIFRHSSYIIISLTHKNFSSKASMHVDFIQSLLII